jgi:predicted CoA-binding protein
MKNTLVFGASLKPSRYSNLAVNRLVSKGVPTQAFGLKAGEVAGVHLKTNPADFHDIHTISLYIGPANQPQYYDTLIGLHPKRVIFNPGTENPEFYALLRKAGIAVEEACTLVLLATGQY